MGRTKPCLLIFLLTIIMLVNSTVAIKPKGFTLRMIHKDSEESPFYNPLDRLITPDERFQTLINQSIARARYIASKINPDVFTNVVYEDTNYYAAKVGIGTFPNEPDGFMNYYLLIDSAADLTWLQCKGATQFFHQDSDLYPWQDSESYHPIPCPDLSPGCQSCNAEGICGYTLSYVGSQVTSGVYAREVFTLTSTTGDAESIRLIMGCGLSQVNFIFGNGSTNAIAGILGLGRGELSFLTQLGDLADGKFSYCFEEYRGRMVGNTDLNFGADADGMIGSQAIRRFTTPIVRTSFQTSYYYLNLEGISVGKDIVPIPSSEFQVNDDQTGGCVIDSGAPYTTMYKDLFDRFANYLLDSHLGQFGMRRAGFPVAQACYIPENGVGYTVPTMTFHFQGGADFVVSDILNLWYLNQQGHLCLAITRSDSNRPAMLFGAQQQINKRILYNIREMSLSFHDEDCG